MVYFKRKSNLKRYLLENGRRIRTRFKRVEIDETTMVNGKHPFRIVSQWRDPGKKLLFTFFSDSVWFDPTEFLIDLPFITVHIDPRNPRKYYVDISFLPNMEAPEQEMSAGFDLQDDAEEVWA